MTVQGNPTRTVLWTACLCLPRFVCWKTLIPNVAVLGGGAFGRWLSLDEAMSVGPPWWDRGPYKGMKHQSAVSPPWEDTAGKQPSVNQAESPTWTLPCWHFDLGLPASWVFKPLSLQYFCSSSWNRLRQRALQQGTSAHGKRHRCSLLASPESRSVPDTLQDTQQRADELMINSSLNAY